MNKHMNHLIFLSLFVYFFTGMTAFAGQKFLPQSGLICHTAADFEGPKELENIQIIAIPSENNGSVNITYINLSTHETFSLNSALIPRYESLTTRVPVGISKIARIREISFFANIGSVRWVALLKPHRWEVSESDYFVAGFECRIQ